MILFLHNRYRTTGGEERTVTQLLRLVREQLGEPAQLLERDSAGLSQAAAARGLLCGGLDPEEVAAAVRAGEVRVVHAHNLLPTLGWRALAAARAQGAQVVVHLHQYRLVCAVGVCFTKGHECTRCHGRNTLPGVLRNCRGARAQALAYGAGLALWQRRVVEQADAVIVPSEFARERLRELGAPLRWERVHVLPTPVWAAGDAGGSGDAGESGDAEEPGVAAGSAGVDRQGPDGGRTHFDDAGEPAGAPRTEAHEGGSPEPYALVVARLSPEKGIDVAIDACRAAGTALVVAGEGPERERLVAHARGADVRFVGRVDDARLARLRAGAALALVPSRSAETFGLAAAEAMAAGLPVAASRVGALPELVDEEGLAAPGDAHALAGAIERVRADPAAGARARARVRATCAPQVVAARLAQVYEAAGGRASGGRASLARARHGA